MPLHDLITTSLLRTTKEFVDALNDAGIRTVEDLLLFFPRAYEDLSAMKTLDDMEDGEKVTIRGVVTDLKSIRTRKKKMMLIQGTFTDSDGNSCEVVWFNQPHIKRMIPDGAEVVLTGKAGWVRNKLTLQSPSFEPGDRTELLHAGRIVPVYPQHAILSTRWLREKMALVKSAIHEFEESLPNDVIEEEKLPSRAQMILQFHFPESPELLQRAKDRFSFEELYALQLQALRRKQEWQQESQERLAIPMNVELIKEFFASLKFKPTDSQRIAIYEILKDMEKTVPMSRLLEGDVGSGKTLVATAVIQNVVTAGGQCALMVPTEVLAKQHAEGVARMLCHMKEKRLFSSEERRANARSDESRDSKDTQHQSLDSSCTDRASRSGAELAREKHASQRDTSVNVALLTGSTPTADAREIKLGLARGTIDIVVGTHALIQSNVVFQDLRLAIVDEQHRFGVEQRKALKEKGSPHFLSMTATPIPRTLALTAYGDHDLSVLLEKPGNRKPITTKVVRPQDRRIVELFIDHEIETGRQAYVICPLIRESEELEDVRNVIAETDRLREAFPNRTIATLHGKLIPKEKDSIMRDFKEKKSDILVSTSVIEVGIDVPNASIILIEGAERFGLAQLHQLRGRVGRDDHQSHCFLCTTSTAQASSARLQAMEQYDSGFQLAEIDLKLRGPGELYGLRQSGIPEIRAGSLMNPALVVRARRAAEKTLSSSGATPKESRSREADDGAKRPSREALTT
ncbi:MAG TPA: ATP-dependent DNA helicase RecG [Candidatus Peribacterales bacterium]|nr:ATP-dependent DNA helicase RecG [Candidatus Peribacterales bacterium]